MQSDNTNTEKKQWVKDRYAAIAVESKTGCCDSGGCCGSSTPKTVAKQIGYGEEDVSAVPEGANLGLGCGNPIAIASIKPGETVLDLGSGAGFDCFLAAERVGDAGKVIGVDMTPEMIDAATRNAQKAGYTNVEFRLGDIEAMPVDGDSVDLIISNCVLNLVPDKQKAFNEIHRVLKPGGRVAVADIVLNSPLPEQLRGDAKSYSSCISGAVMRDEYLGGLRNAVLVDVKVESEVDALKILSGDCGCVGADKLRGVIMSARVTARKPV